MDQQLTPVASSSDEADDQAPESTKGLEMSLPARPEARGEAPTKKSAHVNVGDTRE